MLTSVVFIFILYTYVAPFPFVGRFAGEEKWWVTGHRALTTNTKVKRYPRNVFRTRPKVKNAFIYSGARSGTGAVRYGRPCSISGSAFTPISGGVCGRAAANAKSFNDLHDLFKIFRSGMLFVNCDPSLFYSLSSGPIPHYQQYTKGHILNKTTNTF